MQRRRLSLFLTAAVVAVGLTAGTVAATTEPGGDAAAPATAAPSLPVGDAEPVVVTAPPTTVGPTAPAPVEPTLSPVLAPPTGRTVTVTGTATVSVAPDTAAIDVGTEVIGATGGEVMDQLATSSEALLQALIAEGIPEEVITTTNVSLWPRYGDFTSGSDPEIVGYTGSVNFNVHVDVDRVGATLDILQESVGDDFRVYGLTFSHSDPESLRDQPRIDAVHAARAKAEVLAAAAGVELGGVVAIHEGSTPLPMNYARGEMVASAADSIAIAPGQLQFSTTITVIYELR